MHLLDTNTWLERLLGFLQSKQIYQPAIFLKNLDYETDSDLSSLSAIAAGTYCLIARSVNGRMAETDRCRNVASEGRGDAYP